MGFESVMQILGMLGGAEVATNSANTAPDRVMGAAGSVGTGLTLAGTALTGGLTTTGIGGLSMGALGSVAAGGGAVGAGTAALAAGGVLSAGAGGYAAGTAADILIGRAMGGTQTQQGRGVNGHPTQVADTRRMSERMADATHTATGDRLALRMAPYLPTWLGGDGW